MRLIWALLFCLLPGIALASYNGNGPFNTLPNSSETYPGGTPSTGTWNSSTTQGQTVTLVQPTVTSNSGTGNGGQAIRVSIDISSTISGGAVQALVSADNATFAAPPAWAITSDQSGGYAPITNPITLPASGNTIFTIWMAGNQSAQLKLSTAITGGGTVTIYSTVFQPNSPFPFVLNSVGSLQIAGQGSAGSPGGGVLTVQGVSGGTTLPVALGATTAGGCKPYHLSGGTASSNNATLVKSSAGQWCDLTLVNTTTTLYYLHLYDTSASPSSCGATNLKHVIPIPPAIATGAAGGLERSIPVGEAYLNGLGFCVTSGGADSDNSSAATGVFIEGSFF